MIKVYIFKSKFHHCKHLFKIRRAEKEAEQMSSINLSDLLPLYVRCTCDRGHTSCSWAQFKHSCALNSLLSLVTVLLDLAAKNKSMQIGPTHLTNISVMDSVPRAFERNLIVPFCVRIPIVILFSDFLDRQTFCLPNNLKMWLLQGAVRTADTIWKQ